jgi:group I intron endonuclease
MTCGIYIIRNKKNGHCYVGQSYHIEARWKEHMRNNGSSLPLQNAFRKYGINNFSFEILKECSENKLDILEQKFLDTLHPEYNIATNASNPRLGAKLSPEHIEAIRKASIGNQYAKGFIMTEEHKETLLQTNLGNTYGSALKGIKRSEEFKKKLSENMKGNWRGIRRKP